MKRLFIAINLTEETKNKIQEIIAKFQPEGPGFRLLPPENWHFTITFLGYEPDRFLSAISESTEETAQKFQAPFVKFKNLIYAPPGRPTRMIWLAASRETSKILGDLKNNLENNLVKNGVKFRRESRPYNAHLTLVRFEPGTGTEKQLPPVKEFGFTAASLDLMESLLKRSGAEYEKLGTFSFSS